MTFYKSAFDGTQEELRGSGKQWKMDAIWLVVYVLQASSCYLVALIVYLRLLSVKHPLTFSTKHKRLSNIFSLIIWITLTLIGSVMFILSFLFNEFNNIQEQTYNIIKCITFNIFFSLPILLTIITYGVLLYTLKKRTSAISTQLRDLHIDDTSTDTIYASTAKLTKRIVICLLLCNVPWILWIQYCGLKYPRGGAANVFDTIFGVWNIIWIISNECFCCIYL